MDNLFFIRPTNGQNCKILPIDHYFTSFFFNFFYLWTYIQILLMDYVLHSSYRWHTCKILPMDQLFLFDLPMGKHQKSYRWIIIFFLSFFIYSINGYTFKSYRWVTFLFILSMDNLFKSSYRWNYMWNPTDGSSFSFVIPMDILVKPYQ